MSEDEAPASAYLRAVPSYTAGFVYTERGTSTKERWYSCPYCKSSTIPSIGCVLDPGLNVKPVNEWDMNFPIEIQSSKPIRAWTDDDVCVWLAFQHCQGGKHDSVSPSPR